jgi:hypothetical protein
MKLIILIINILTINYVVGQTKVDKGTKKEITEFVTEYREAVIAKDSIWIKAHTSNDTYDLISSKTNHFNSEKMINNLYAKLSMKQKITRYNSGYAVSFGKYSETTDYSGGAIFLKKNDGIWLIIKYKCRHL